MSQFDDISLFCEDEPNGPTIRLLAIAVQSLRREVRIATLVEPLPAGGKSDVKVRVRHARVDQKHVRAGQRRAFGIRDRDFLSRKLLDVQRERALLTDAKAAEAWPLSRHCIESYLLEPSFLVSVLGQAEAEWNEMLEGLAAERRWLDLGRAVLNDARWRASNSRWPKLSKLISTRGEAVAAISAQCAEMLKDATEALDEKAAFKKFDELDQDFTVDGPLATRVDGKELLNAVGARLREEGREPKGGLGPALLAHADRDGCPALLVGEVRELLLGIQGALGIV
ncbi:hypothetical protein [Chondromyces apiculatus]|uniref:Uncharacterized protein n=1 Tax=Chondromyces apiculatus DSM 436 TaxID=1192034 RepID=A0A017T162_9BACT|nr:hypothetical protein [Chondromyces apiculatus]EYF02545.1 Hypothetical protein CAP_6752 [Chondromyces apiculatus DSM 436]